MLFKPSFLKLPVIKAYKPMNTGLSSSRFYSKYGLSQIILEIAKTHYELVDRARCCLTEVPESR